jgi:nucleolar MIF4G domain-containing protein 1
MSGTKVDSRRRRRKEEKRLVKKYKKISTSHNRYSTEEKRNGKDSKKNDSSNNKNQERQRQGQDQGKGQERQRDEHRRKDGDTARGIGRRSDSGGSGPPPKGNKKKKQTVQREGEPQEKDPGGEEERERHRRLLREDDEEIRYLERMLGISTGRGRGGKGREHQKQKQHKLLRKLNREYELEGYGGGFADFLFTLDDVLAVGESQAGSESENASDDNEKEEEERTEGSSFEEEEEEESRSLSSTNDDRGRHGEDEDVDSDDDGSLPAESSTTAAEEDNVGPATSSTSEDEGDDDEGVDDDANTYRPTTGQDIYGRPLPASKEDSSSPANYVPPHLRKMHQQQQLQQRKEPLPTAPQTLTPRPSSSSFTGPTAPAEHGDEQDDMRVLRLELNRILNRLSEETLVRTVQGLAALYPMYPATTINQELWDSLRRICIVRHALSTGVTPVCAAVIRGLVSWLAAGGGAGGRRGAMGGSSSSYHGVGEHLTECIVLQLWGYLSEPPLQPTATARNPSAPPRRDGGGGDDNGSDGTVNPLLNDKTPANLILLLGYLYNFGVVHCTLLYDIIRRLVELSSPSGTLGMEEQQKQQRELAVELLLIILSHCGRALRSDDPTALREIVMSVVQSRTSASASAAPAASKTSSSADATTTGDGALETAAAASALCLSSMSSRVEYMVGALLDLKNNKRRRQDTAHAERTTRLRKLLGSSSSSSSSSPCLRITLDDILHADTRGRWWKVGASWAGGGGGASNQLRRHPSDADPGSAEAHSLLTLRDRPQASDVASASYGPAAVGDEELLQLASKFRMNTDLRRAIFCVIMGSDDCDDAFEKLVRGGMLKARSEREAVRVLMECCGGEKSFNKFYAHLARRMLEYQPQGKFSLQLALWDTFKQFATLKVRKAANLAKLLFELVAVHRCLRLNVLRPIDVAAPEDLPEPALIFLTVFFTCIMHHFDDPLQVADLFRSGIASSKRRKRRRTGSFARAGQDEAPRGFSDSEDGDDGVASDDGGADEVDGDDELEGMDEGDALRAGFLVFFVQVLKKSPEYTKKVGEEGGSSNRFRRNLKAAIKACDVEALFE